LTSAVATTDAAGQITADELTADAAGPVSGAQLGASLTGYILTYALMLVAYMVVLTHLAGKGGGPEPRPAAAMALGSAA
jgi:cytochrome bd-type quinol oxidase subunit 1